MTRVCMYCNTPYGEKCAKCQNSDNATSLAHNRDLPIHARTARDALVAKWINPSNWYLCESCGVAFQAGDGGKTHGICFKCRKERNQ